VRRGSSLQEGQGHADETPALARTVAGVSLVGVTEFETGYTFDDTEVGGLSSIAFDRANSPSEPAGRFFALSDDRSQRAPARFYTLRIDIGDGSLDDGDVVFESVTTLLDGEGKPFAEGAIDPEGVSCSASGTLFVSSEGDARKLVPPSLFELSMDGRQLSTLSVPEYYVPNEAGDRGVRNNLAFEPLTITPDGLTLLTGTENALVQDGPATDLETRSPARLLQFDLTGRQPSAEYVYMVEAVPKAPVPAGAFSDNGLVELAALDDVGTFLALERSYAVGRGNTVRLFEISTAGALDVLGRESLRPSEAGGAADFLGAVEKRLLADLEELGVRPDNLEGMTLGPILPDGRQSLIVVSDNNFNPLQSTQFIALALEVEAVPSAPPVYLPAAIRSAYRE